MTTNTPRILLAYQDSVKLQMLKACLLQEANYTIISASSGHDAVEALQNEAFHAVISDIELPNINAWRLTRLVRSGILATDAHTPVIIVSSTFSERIAETTVKEIEANGFLPFSQYQQLSAMLRDILASETIRPPKNKLLVIEDYCDTTDIIRRVLNKRFDIDVAEDGEQGLNMWREQHYDLVLLDLMLPKMSGKDVLRHMMREKPSQSVIMMTAFGNAERAGSLLLEGAVDFISKPFRAEQLRQVTSIAAHCEDYMVSNQQYIDSQLALADEQERAQVTLASIGDGVITTDADGRIVYLNPVAEALTGWKTDEVREMPLREIFDTYHEYSKVPAVNPLDRCLREKRPIESSNNILLRNRYAQELVIEHSASPIRDKHNGLAGAVMVFRDNTESRQMAQQLSFHASHDSLTGLNNRAVLDRAISHVVAELPETRSTHTLCHLNINHFKLINDSCGHAAGDQVLQALADLLVKQIRVPSDTIARLGSDEFGILLRHCPTQAAERIASDIVKAIEAYSFDYNEHQYKVGVSIGLTAITEDTPDCREIMSSAETACKMASERGGNRYHIFSTDDDEQLQRRGEMQIITQLLKAERENQFELYYQPIAPINSQEACSYELLLRLKNDDGNIVAPGVFLGAAERYNIMPQIDRWVLQHALTFFAENPDIVKQAAHFSINLSGQSLSDDTCYSFIEELLARTGVSPEKICFEITETAAISNFIRAGSFISAIRDLGCKFALDDFGSGMSSFAYLKKLPVDFLKIDGMFVKGILDDPIDMAMVRSINDIGHVLELKTIAEFVENGEILEGLADLGVDYAQGYHIAKPAPLLELKQRLSGNNGIGKAG
jgi:diguanylate cyclase (GGDEF)-like protein/PAS domain S-box-containing protein